MYMENAKYFNLQKYKDYKEFIISCSNKTYDTSMVLHKHHIIPKHMWHHPTKNVNSSENMVKLSVEDHVNAHLLLAECYDENTYEYNSNLRSARILNRKSIRDIDTLNRISKSYIGEKNPFYNKTHTKEVRQILSEKTKLNFEGVSYDERYGERASMEKKKRSTSVKMYWDNIDEVAKKNRAKKVAASLKGKMGGSNNPFATKLIVDGVYYGSLVDACNSLKTTPYKLYKHHTVEKINKK